MYPAGATAATTAATSAVAAAATAAAAERLVLVYIDSAMFACDTAELAYGYATTGLPVC